MNLLIVLAFVFLSQPGNMMIQITEKGPKLIIIDCGIVTTSSEKHESLINVLLSMLKFDGKKAGMYMLEESNRADTPG